MGYHGFTRGITLVTRVTMVTATSVTRVTIEDVTLVTMVTMVTMLFDYNGYPCKIKSLVTLVISTWKCKFTRL